MIIAIKPPRTSHRESSRLAKLRRLFAISGGECDAEYPDALMLKSALISRAGRFVAGDLVKMAEE
jgi:hypothetical protein